MILAIHHKRLLKLNTSDIVIIIVNILLKAIQLREIVTQVIQERESGILNIRILFRILHTSNKK